MLRYAIVIPAFNEERTIRDIAKRCSNISENVYIVDDGSSDRTIESLEGLPVRILKHEKNRGKAMALWTGMQHCLKDGYDGVITIDADGQHNPEDIPLFIEAAKSNPNKIIVGSRLGNPEAFPPNRLYGNEVANFWISWAAGYIIEDSQSGFRYYPSSLIKKLKIKISKERSFVFESEILIKAAWLGYKGIFIPIEAIYDTGARPSHFRGFHDVMLIIRMVAWKLIIRGMNPPGIFRILRYRLKKRFNLVGLDGFFTLFLALIFLILTGGLAYVATVIHVLLTALRADPNPPARGTRIVAGMRLDHGKINDDFKLRLDAAIRSAGDEYPVLILGGRTSSARISEAEAGKEYLVSRGLDPEKIQCEDQSRHTLENFQNAREHLNKEVGIDHVLITNRYHLARSSAFASGFKISHVICAAETEQAFNFRLFFHSLREGFFLYWYYVGNKFAHFTSNRTMLRRIS